MGYLTISDLVSENRYFESFAESFYGTNGTLDANGSTKLIADITAISKGIDDKLRTTGRFSVLPIQKNESGAFPQSVVDWCAYQLIYRKTLAKFQTEFGEIPPVVNNFRELSKDAASNVIDGDVIFDTEVSAGDLGIGQPTNTIIGSNTRGTFHNNWRGFPYGDSGMVFAQPPYGSFGRFPYTDSYRGYMGHDYPRRFVMNIITPGGIGTAEFRYSRNSGKDWDGTMIAKEEWDYVTDNVYVRFGPDQNGSNYFSVGDTWNFLCVPRDTVRVYAKDEMRMVKSSRGF